MRNFHSPKLLYFSYELLFKTTLTHFLLKPNKSKPLSFVLWTCLWFFHACPELQFSVIPKRTHFAGKITYCFIFMVDRTIKFRVYRDPRDHFYHFPPNVSTLFLIFLVARCTSYSTAPPTSCSLPFFQGGRVHRETLMVRKGMNYSVELNSSFSHLILFFSFCLHGRPKAENLISLLLLILMVWF